jgi:hypothetical protein
MQLCAYFVISIEDFYPELKALRLVQDLLHMSKSNGRLRQKVGNVLADRDRNQHVSLFCLQYGNTNPSKSFFNLAIAILLVVK